MTGRPHVVVLGTGGTIAGAGAVGAAWSAAAASPPTPGPAYRAAVLSVQELIAGLPQLADLAQVSSEQVLQVDSVDMDLDLMLGLARRVGAELARDDVDAVVVTHGTDTLEESAYLVNLTVRTRKPIVFLGSMRPADALSADGPANLFNAVAVAASPAASGQGVLVVLGEEIHAARDVAKRHTSHTDAFASEHGPLGDVSAGRPRFYRALARRHTFSSAFDIGQIAGAPAVEVAHTHAQMPLALLDAMAAGSRALVLAGPGAGSVPTRVSAHLRRLSDAGLIVVRSSRVGAGPVLRGGSVDDDALGWVVADDLNPWKARVLTAVALTATGDPSALQEFFHTH